MAVTESLWVAGSVEHETRNRSRRAVFVFHVAGLVGGVVAVPITTAITGCRKPGVYHESGRCGTPVDCFVILRG